MQKRANLAALLHALQDARAYLAAHDEQRARGALDRAFGEIGTAYARLDASGSPSVARHLMGVYDTCLEAIGAAQPGETARLDAAIALLSFFEPATPSPSMRVVQGSARPQRISYRPTPVERTVKSG
jgi:hypothetical protein